jgi:uncharacterized membrane protein
MITVAVKESQTRGPGWGIDEVLKAVVSRGVIAPAEMR